MTSLLRNSTLLRLTELLLTHVSVVFVEFKLRVVEFLTSCVRNNNDERCEDVIYNDNRASRNALTTSVTYFYSTLTVHDELLLLQSYRYRRAHPRYAYIMSLSIGVISMND